MTLASLICQRLIGGHFVEDEVKVVIEKELPIFINGEYLITASLSPGMEREFVAGYLFGQGFIEKIDEVESMNITDNVAKVNVKDERRVLEKIRKTDYRVVSGGGKTVFSDKMTFSVITSQVKISKNMIFKAMNTIFEKAGIYQETEGVHTIGLFKPEAVPLCITEDIGRHNTLDKAIGFALMNKIDCAQLFLASTGRIASEMVTKICRAGIPVVATKTAVTDAGMEIGRRYGLTIIGFVRDAGTRINTDMETRIISEPGMKIYTNFDRIIFK